MVLINENKSGNGAQMLTPEEILNSPVAVAGISGMVYLVMLAAIKLTRVSASSAVESFHTYVDVDGPRNAEKLVDRLKWSRIVESFKLFMNRLPTRVWNFYIQAFIVPGYRKEWGKYNNWNFRSRPRAHQAPEVRLQVQIEKRLQRQAASLKRRRPRPVPHDHTECQRVTINMAGMRYETQLKTLERFPNTLLGCADKRIQYWNPSNREYYFDRSRLGFEAILYFYQSGGRLRRPENISADVLIEDAEFFELGAQVIESLKTEEGMSPPSARTETIPANLLMRKVWLLFEFPESSVQAKICTCVSICALFISIGLFCLETLDELQLKGVVETNATGHTVMLAYSEVDINDPFFMLETVCNAWFVFEYVCRFTSSPFKIKFVRSPINLIDLFAVFPFFITLFAPETFEGKNLAADSNSFNDRVSDSLYLLRIVRLVRVFRIFRLSKHSKGLKILGKTLRASLNELLLLIFFVFIAVVLFSSTMYFAEFGARDPATGEKYFTSVPDGFWWAVVTITTVGFGDNVPVTTTGKIVGALCAVAGVLTIALPVPVIVSNFNFFYHQAIDENEVRWISINHVASCPYRPGGSCPDPERAEESEEEGPFKIRC